MAERMRQSLRALALGAALVSHPADSKAEPITITIEDIYSGNRQSDANEEDSRTMRVVLDHPKVVEQIAQIRASKVIKDESGQEYVKATGTWALVTLDGPTSETMTHVVLDTSKVQLGQVRVEVYEWPKTSPAPEMHSMLNARPKVGSVISY